MATNLDNERGLSITEARSRLTQLPEQLAAMGWAIPLTRHGEPVMALMSWELFQSIEETLEIMGDPELIAALRESIKEAAEGKTLLLEDVKAELGR